MSHTRLPRIAYTLFDLIQAAQAARPGHTALVDGNRRVTYSDLAGQSAGFASFLLRSGINRGDRVALYLPRSIEAVVALFGIWSVGAPVPDLHEKSLIVLQPVGCAADRVVQPVGMVILQLLPGSLIEIRCHDQCKISV